MGNDPSGFVLWLGAVASAGLSLVGAMWAFLKFFGAPKMREVVRDAVKTEIDSITVLAGSVQQLAGNLAKMREDYVELTRGMHSLGHSMDRLREATNSEIVALRERMVAQETISSLFGRRDADRFGDPHDGEE